jgi:L-carnitine CoA-transferase/bile acid-CoA hydrolase
MKVINNVLHQSFTNHPEFGILKGVKVFITGTNIAGPFAGSLMSEMGAQVVQAESPKIPCQTRGDYGWAQNKRNVYSLTLNSATKAGKDVFLKAIEWADIWIEAGRPGSYAKSGLSDDVCWEINPKLTIVHVSGFGQFGPYKDQPSYDAIGQAMGGYIYMNGEGPTAQPLKVNPYLSDYVTAYNTALCALAGHLNSVKYGEGDSCDVAQYDTMFRMLDIYPAKWFNCGYPAAGEPVPDRMGNAGAACGMGFFTSKDGGSIYLTMTGVGPVHRGYPLIGVPEEDYDETCTGYIATSPIGIKINGILADFCLKYDLDELEAIFNENAIPCQKVYGPEQMLKDPQYEARENIVEWEDAVYGPMKGIGITNRFQKNPSEIFSSAPTMGEHNREILTAWGFSEEEIDTMYARGEMVTWTAADTARNKKLKEWGFFWDPDRQCERLGL